MGTIECNDEANNFKYKLVLETTVESLRLAIENKTGTSVAENCYAFIDAIEGISTGVDCTDCENNLQSCIDAKALLETEITDLNSQIATLTSDLNTCTTDKADIQSNLDDCIAEKATLQTALDTANETIVTLNARLDVVNSRLDTIIGHEVVGDETDKLDEVEANKLAIENAIVLKKGSELNDASDFSTYSTEIDNLEIYIDHGWDRPHEWIDMPSWGPTAGEAGDIMKILVTIDAVDGAKIGFNIAGNVTVDWGQGEETEDFNAGGVRKEFDATGTTHQIIVEVTPQSGERFTLLNFNIKNSDGSYCFGIDEVKLSTDNTIDIYSLLRYTYDNIKSFEIVGELNVNTLAYVSNNSLAKNLRLNLANINQSSSSMFKGAYISIADDIHINSTNLFYMFGLTIGGDASKIIINAENASSCQYLFYYSELDKISITNTQNIATFNSSFKNATRIRKIELDMLSCTNALSMFVGNASLTEINLTNCSTSIDIQSATALPAEQINYFILNGLVDVSSGDAKTITLTGTVTESELSQEVLDHAVAYGWDLVF